MTEVFLGREALGDGLSRQDLRRWYRPMFRGVYVPKWATPTLRDRALGAWLTSDRTAVIAGTVASALHGAEWVDATEPVEVLVGERRRQSGLIVRMDRIAEDETVTVDDLPVTTPARTAFDMGRHLKRHNAIGRLDALMRAAPFDRDQVTALTHRYGPVRGVRQLRQLLPVIDAGAESLKESWLRLVLIDHGFAVPQTQIPVYENGVAFAYLDMGWRDIKLAVEYDGDHHRTVKEVFVNDRRRLARIEAQGWEVIRVINEDHKSEILQRVYGAYVRRGGAELDEIARISRTSAPERWFGRDPEAA